MLGNGVKRKLNEVEDGLEEGIVGTMPPGAGTGTVHAAVGGGLSRATYALQRQTVLNMSLMKLYGPRAGPDPGLQRRVLINNMIRHIHEEFKQEGGGGVRALFFAVQQPAAAPRSASSDVNGDDEGYHRQAPSLPPPPSFSILSSLDSCLTPASLLEEDSPLFFALPPSSSPHPVHHYSSPQPPPPPPAPSPQKDSFSTALEEIEELCPTVVVTASSSPSLSSPYTSSGALLSSPQMAQALSVDVSMKEVGQNSQEKEEEEEEERAMEKPALPLPPPPSTTTDTPSSSPAQGFLTDFALDDILFTDIDTSMYDFGPGGGTSPSVTSSKMAPVGMADDLVKTISSYGGTGGGSSQNQPFKMDLAELDHIMEVLVGS